MNIPVILANQVNCFGEIIARQAIYMYHENVRLVVNGGPHALEVVYAGVQVNLVSYSHFNTIRSPKTILRSTIDG